MPTTSPIPIHHVVSRTIMQRIDEGEYEVGNVLPTEEQFAAQFAVSRTTIRRALDDIEAAGMILRQRGSGTYVQQATPPRIGQVLRGSMSGLLEEARQIRASSVTVDRNTEIPATVAKTLRLDKPVGTIVRRIRTVGGTVFAITNNYLADADAKALSARELKQRSLMTVLKERGFPLVSASQTIRAEVASIDTAAQLELPYAGAPILFVERVSVGAGGRPVQVLRSWYRSDLYEFMVEFA